MQPLGVFLFAATLSGPCLSQLPTSPPVQPVHVGCCSATDPAIAGADHAPEHREMLARLADGPTGPPLACCFTGNVPWRTMEAFEAALRDPREHQFTTRWNYSATNAGYAGVGEPIVLTYSFVPDGTSIPGAVGEPTAPSNMVAVFDAIQGRSNWQNRMHLVFGRWSSLCGITFRHEPNDDGAAFPTSPGQLGVRGDLRIGGHYIDGQIGGNILAYAYYPHTGDIVFDTSNTTFFADATNNAVPFRNTLAHEIGHSIGARHVCPINSTKLMEPYLTTAFDGPQHDEVRGAQRFYGDRYENDDSPATANDLGALDESVYRANVSVDGPVDTDWYRFTVDTLKKVTVTLTPIGATYLEGPQTSGCTSVTSVNSLLGNDLRFELYAADGSTLLRRIDEQPAGGTETLPEFVVWTPGTYFVRVAGAPVAEVQLYTLRIAPTEMARVLRTFAGAGPGDEFGAAAANLGDLDGDGYGEVLVGAPRNRDRGPRTGMARIFSGRTQAVQQTLYGVADGDEFGRAVAAAGDVDRDGIVDFMVGAPGDDASGLDAGSVRLFSGRTGAVLRTVYGAGAGERFGAAVAGIGDTNLDGVPDLCVGAPGGGSARMLSGGDGRVLATLAQGGPLARFGAAVAAAGDVNRDGFPDVVVGAPDDPTNGAGSGSAYVFSGFMASGALLWTFRGSGAGENLGVAVAGAGDTNRDQYADIVIGALRDARAGRGTGYAVVFSGRDGREQRRFASATAGDMFAFAVANVGDVDADGFPDLAVGASGSGPGDPGYVKLFSGRGDELVTLPGETPDGGFGVVAGAGDVDGDAWPDVAVGAPRGGTNGAGTLRVFSASIQLRAGSKPIGAGCGAGAAPPTLTTDLPELGRTAHAQLFGAAPARAGSILAGGVVASPLALGGCRIYLELSQVTGLATFFTSSGGAAGASIRLPQPDASLIGAQLTLQAIVAPTAGPLGFDLTNGVIWTLRPVP